MVVRLRFARPPLRTKLTTRYDIVVINIKKARDAKPIEKLGEYDPVPRILGTGPGAGRPGSGHKRVEWSTERIKYWLDQGALPSKSLVTLFERGGLLPLDHKYKPMSSTSSSTSSSSSTPSPPSSASSPSTPTATA